MEIFMADDSNMNDTARWTYCSADASNVVVITRRKYYAAVLSVF